MQAAIVGNLSEMRHTEQRKGWSTSVQRVDCSNISMYSRVLLYRRPVCALRGLKGNHQLRGHEKNAFIIGVALTKRYKGTLFLCFFSCLFRCDRRKVPRLHAVNFELHQSGICCCFTSVSGPWSLASTDGKHELLFCSAGLSSVDSRIGIYTSPYCL
jgi:hypothetical protein